MCRCKTALAFLTCFVLLSLCASASAGVDWGYGWPNGPTVPPNTTPTPTAAPNSTDTPTATPDPPPQVTPTPTATTTPTDTPTPTNNIDPVQTVNPTANPTQAPSKIPELTLIFALLGLIAASLIIVVFYRRKHK